MVESDIKKVAYQIAGRYYAAKTREERLEIRREFCERFSNSTKLDKYWDMIVFKKIAVLPEVELPEVKQGRPPRAVVLHTGTKRIRYPSLKVAAEQLNIHISTVYQIASGKTKNPIYNITYAEVSQS